MEVWRSHKSSLDSPLGNWLLKIEISSRWKPVPLHRRSSKPLSFQHEAMSEPSSKYEYTVFINEFFWILDSYFRIITLLFFTMSGNTMCHSSQPSSSFGAVAQWYGLDCDVYKRQTLRIWLYSLIFFFSLLWSNVWQRQLKCLFCLIVWG